jgi:hypothetical protein
VWQTNTTQNDWARRLLAREGASGSAADCATAAGRIYDKLHARLDPILGVAGVHALFLRSARLSSHELASIPDAAALESSTKLVECLRAQDPATALASSTALFGTFYMLITNFIGEGLTSQVLRGAFPALEETSTEEPK